jgi:hypothetical protein
MTRDATDLAYSPATGGVCLRHCREPTEVHPFRWGPQRMGWLYSCPAGAVSTAVVEGGASWPSPNAFARFIRSSLLTRAPVRVRDFRAASRYGPELGSEIERGGPSSEPRPPLRLIYWRLYPWKVRGQPRSLFVCFRHGEGTVRFFVADPTPGNRGCPECARSSDVRPRTTEKGKPHFRKAATRRAASRTRRR